jgi:hypothetical protein
LKTLVNAGLLVGPNMFDLDRLRPCDAPDLKDFSIVVAPDFKHLLANMMQNSDMIEDGAL